MKEGLAEILAICAARTIADLQWLQFNIVLMRLYTTSVTISFIQSINHAI